MSAGEPLTADAVRYYTFWSGWMRVALVVLLTGTGAILVLLVLIWRTLAAMHAAQGGAPHA